MINARFASALLLFVLAASLLGADCVREDISGVQELNVEAGVAEAAYALPYVGRITADVAVANQSAAPLTLTVSLQASTSGDPDREGCETLSLSSANNVGALAWDGGTLPDALENIPTIDDFDFRQALELDAATTGFAGLVRLDADTSRFRIYLSEGDASLFDENGNPVVPLRESTETTCGESNVTEYDFPDDRVYLGIESAVDAVSLVVVESCEAQRAVSRTCPGALGDIRSRALTVPASEELITRFTGTTVGVGDQLALRASCEEPTDCEAMLRISTALESLDCRTEGDCGGNQECTTEGFCVRESSGGCQSSPSGSSHVLLGLMVLAFFVHRGRWRAGVTGLLFAAVVFASLPARPAHAQQDVQEPRFAVFVLPTLETGHLLGNAGELTSWSLGGGLRQGLRFERVSTWLRLQGDAYLTYQDAPPLSRGMRSFTLGLGAAYNLRFDAFRTGVFVEYASVSLGGNPLTETLGARRQHHAPGTGFTVAWLPSSPLVFEVSVAWHAWVTTAERTSRLGIWFSVGIENTIRR